MMRNLYILLVFCFLIIGQASAQNLTPFKKSDRIVFDGNSITDGGHYHSYIWLYYMTRFPNARIDIFNAGIGGDVARQIYERMDSDAIVHHPNVLCVTFGMNDTGYQFLSPQKADSVYAAKVAQSLQSFGLMEMKLKAHPEIRNIMIGSPPYEETSKNKNILLKGKNNAIKQIIVAQKQIAQKNKWEFIDFNQPLLDVNLHEQQKDSLFTLEGTDRIHPTNDGHMIMAYVFLRAQGFSDKKVAQVAIDAKQHKLLSSDNCLITQLHTDAQSVTYSYLANALPYPVDTIAHGGNPMRTQASALKLIPFTDEFNQEIVKVDGLDAGKNYTLKIDNKLIGSWPGSQYKTGINLAEQVFTPQYQQALAVMHLNEERWSIERKLREYYWLHYSILKPKGMLYNDSEPVVDSLKKYAKKDIFVGFTIDNYLRSRLPEVREAWRKEMALLTDEIYRINKPRTHRVEITATNK